MIESNPVFNALNLGCGDLSKDQSGYRCWNVDKRKTPIVHQVVDLDVFPYPFGDATYGAIFAYDILEHIDDMVKAVEECHRILKPRGVLFIHTNDWRKENAFTDPTHRHFCTPKTFDFFCPETDIGKKYHWYSASKFEKVHWQEEGEELYFALRKI